MIRMAKLIRTLLAAGAAIVSLGLTAAAVQAEPTSEEVAPEIFVPLRIFDRQMNTLLMPQFREPHPSVTPRRPPKPTTLLQVDARIGEESDVMLRLQAKQKQFLLLEFRF